MKRIFKIVTSFTDEQSFDRLCNLDDSELVKMLDLEYNPNFKSFYFDGDVCHWKNGHLQMYIFIADRDELDEILIIDSKLHIGLDGFTKYEDITEDILYDVHDLSVYGYAMENMEALFHFYRRDHLTKDVILDKILKYGIDSLTENDRKILEDKKMVAPFSE